MNLGSGLLDRGAPCWEVRQGDVGIHGSKQGAVTFPAASDKGGEARAPEAGINDRDAVFDVRVSPYA